MLAMIPIAEGAVVVFLIILLQYIFAWLARSSTKMEKLINTVPRIVFYNNMFQKDKMAREAHQFQCYVK